MANTFKRVLFCTVLALVPAFCGTILADTIDSDFDVIDTSYENFTDGIVTVFVAPGEITGSMSGGCIFTMQGGKLNAFAASYTHLMLPTKLIA